MVELCDEGRKGNHFCLRLSDAEFLTYILNECILKNSAYPLWESDIRYSALNLQSIAKFGTVEFRTIGTNFPFTNIEYFANVFEKLLTTCKKFRDPIDFITHCSGSGGIHNTLLTVLEELASPITGIPDYRDKLINSMRFVQDFAFSTDNWDNITLGIQQQERKTKA